ncbi:MAG: hypothetical protein V4527_10805 [Pseudomonadota bacterium]
MRGWKLLVAAAATALLGANAVRAGEEADTNAAMARCQSEAAKYQHGPLAGKLSLMALPTAAMMADPARPSAAEIPVIQDFAASMETCQAGFKSLAIRYVPESLPVEEKATATRQAMLVDLLAGRISYGQANIRDRDAKQAYSAAMQTLIAQRAGQAAPSAGSPFAPQPQFKTPPSMTN